MARTNEWTETLVDWVDGRLRQTRFSNLWLGGGPGANGGTNYRPVDGQLTQRHVCYDTSEDASPCSPSGFSSLVDNLRRIRYWQEPATWFGLETTSGLKVTIKPGLWYPSTTEYCAFTGGDSPTFTLPGVLDRIDTVYIDPSGILHIQRGTPAVSPTITLPPIASGIPLWAIYLTPTALDIYHPSCSGYYAGQGYIERDLRPFLNLGGGGGVAASGVPNATAEGQALVSNAALQWTADTTPLWKGEHSFEGGISILTGQGITMADETWIGIGAGAERIIFDTAGDICVMGANFGIGVNPPDVDLHVHGANSVTIKLTNDDTGIAGNVGLDIGVATDESAYMWNRENTELSFGTNNLRRVTILANGKIGFNTATIPHGAVGAAKFAIHGTDVSSAGPHIQLTTDSDDHPLLQILADSHDDVFIFFDAYYDYASWKSSDLGSNCMLGKENDQLVIKYDSNVGQGNNITWNTGIVMNLNNGHVGIGESTPGGKLDVAWGGTGTYMTLQLGADSANKTRTNITNKYVHMGAYHYTNIEEPIGMMYVASTSLVSRLDIGGGSGLLNAATRVSLYAAANTTTTTGTEIVRATSTYFLIDPTATGVNVGIGTAVPGDVLEIYKDQAAATRFVINNPNAAGKTTFLFKDGAVLQGWVEYDNATLDLSFQNWNGGAFGGIALNPSGGYVCIGALTSENVMLHIQADNLGALTMPVGNTLLLEQDNNAFMNMVSGTADHVGMRFGDPADTDIGYIAYENNNDAMVFGTNAGERMRISNAGAFQWSNYGVGALTSDAAGNITAVSDARLKEQVRDTEIGLSEVLQMQGKAWHYTKESGLDTEYEYLGFIADDIEKIIPQAVGRMSDGMRTLNPNALLPAVVKAIQELDTRLVKGGL